MTGGLADGPRMVVGQADFGTRRRGCVRRGIRVCGSPVSRPDRQPWDAAGAGVSGAIGHFGPHRACSICTTPTASSPPSAGPVRRFRPRWRSGLADAVPLWVAILLWLLLWVAYLSIVNVGQIWYSFGWESLLLEAGLLVAFVGNDDVAPPVLVMWLTRWLLFRVEFGAGLIKLRGDRCWRDLTCLDFHHETQPMPGPLSWFFHHLPRPFHRVEVAGNHVAQLIVPFGLFAPAAGRQRRRGDHRRHPVVARPLGQLLLAELADDRAGRQRDRHLDGRGGARRIAARGYACDAAVLVSPAW